MGLYRPMIEAGGFKDGRDGEDWDGVLHFLRYDYFMPREERCPAFFPGSIDLSVVCGEIDLS